MLSRADANGNFPRGDRPKAGAWLALMMGNSRLHWALFQASALQRTWDTPPGDLALAEAIAPILAAGQIPPDFLPQGLALPPGLPLRAASVVPAQADLWRHYPNYHAITLDHLSLQDCYPTLGIDRALALLGVGDRLGFPALVIDAGTALTLTGADGDRRLIGGAILPGLGLQFRSLAHQTAALPNTLLPDALPLRWATQTPLAIQSGIVYTVVAGVRDFLRDWLQRYPTTALAITGGDGAALHRYLKDIDLELGDRLHYDPRWIFWGMAASVLGTA